MAKARRLLVVAGLLGVAAIVSSSWSAGEPAANKVPPPAAGKRPAPPLNLEPAEKALAQSKFAEAKLVSYRPLQGDPYFALQVQPKLEPALPRPRDYLLLVNSSAGQAGPAWLAACQIADGIVKDANALDRISIWALSTPEFTQSLTNKVFLNVKDDAKKIQDALKKLRNQEYPAGNTDLKSGLAKAIDNFDGLKIARQRIIVYLGDGLSTFAPVRPAERQDLCKDMIDKRIVLFSVPLGDQLGPDNLHGLATGSGGVVLRTQILSEKLEDVLKRYQEAFAAPVLYPDKKGFKLSEEAQFYPTEMPPLRSDSPTLVVGRFKPGKSLTYSVQGSVSGQPVTVTHEEPVPEAELDNFFLISLVDQWKNAENQPALMRADRALASAFQQIRLQQHELLLSAEVAIQQNQLDAAGQLFDKAQQLAPHNREADAGRKLVANLKSGKVTLEMIRRQLDKNHQIDQLKKVNGAVQVSKTDFVQLAQLDEKNQLKAEEVVPPLAQENLLQQQHDRIILEEQKMTQAVEGNLRQARAELASDPDAALELLRSTLLRVRDHPDLGDRVRDALLSRLQTALREVTSQGKAIKLRKQQDLLNIDKVKKERAELEQRQTLEDRTEAQFRVFKNLMTVARVEEKTKHEVIYGLEAMAADLRLKGQPVPTALKATYDQVLAGYHLYKNQELKRLREERFLSVMLDVEKSHVPFPDEPAIHFPPLATWEAIRKLRKEKYEVSSLPDDYKGRKEANSIKELLDEEIEMKDFQAPMTLKEALGLFMERFAGKQKDLPILVDTEAFKEENPDAPSIYDTPIQFQPYPKKMMLATALRLALAKVNPPNATYLIRRNYIEITTIERQTRERVLRVYPVGELVIPISQQMGGGMMGGGMMGMMGGGMMGMMGGGMMGMMGGGMMGGMMGMGGMGMMGGGMGGMMMGGMGGMGMMGQMMGGMGGMGMMGQMMGGMGGMGMMGQMMGGMGGMGMGGMGMMGGSFTGGSFMGSFNGALGAMGAILAPSLISTITKVVAPGEWFITQQPQPFNTFLGGGLNNLGGVGAIGGPQLGQMGQPPPLPLPEGGPANIQDANTIEFFPPALALLIRAPARVHTSFTGGLIGGRPKRNIEAARLDAENRGLDLVRAGNKNGNVGGVIDENKVLAAKGKKFKVPVEDLDATKIWQEELAKGGVDAGLVVATADLLFESGKFKHAAEFLKAVLRQGIVARPWVYESLAVALEASGGSQEEIRRARLSALALDPQDSQGFISAARTMAEHKQYDRALAFCRQAALLEPNLAQPYAQAVAYAQLGKDSQAMEWAVGKLLGQDWPADNQVLHVLAQNKGQDLAQILHNEKRGSEADRLKAALQKLGQRDLIINLTWQDGDDAADLDLVVTEPCGSVCSVEQRQTPGGGIMTGNTLTETNRASYMAAQAFSGEYDITVRRNWGQTLGKRARLEIIQHLGTPQESRKLLTVSVDGTSSTTVKLADGRRMALATIPPPAAQRQRDDKEEAKSMNIWERLRQSARPDYSQAKGVRGGAWTPGALLPAEAKAQPNRKQPERVAYQTGIAPQLGGAANLNAQAVVSADRRYVRLSVTPVFQTVTGSGPLVNLPLIPGSRP